ncbi:beta-ketoacyl synthase chain length factor [Streptomyces sp. Ag109_O5-10]|uniref:beta-ketoacyl synthase chain length factor n=1 Tax=Streptomyces sp. Ag109_O5-10 TaxID=1855349 RepID=UPI000895B2E1|nr:beta-ketoacyl synthase chain length factor [Streptomyces sp. Ag109_O5-10]SEF00302.1 Beta-ketoacyl synthase, N-terminal domain [Streptomyces sp. Ag109_O5-10]
MTARATYRESGPGRLPQLREDPSMPTVLSKPRAIASAACRTPWGEAAAGLPGAAEVELPKVVGFVVSRFSPLVHDVVTACLGEPGSTDDLVGAAGPRTAVVLATLFGDTTTTDTATQRLVAGQVHSPLLFFQSVTTSILGHLTKRYGITGQLTCLSAGGDLATEAFRAADLLLDQDAVEQVLVIGVETAPGERATWVHGRTAAEDGLDALPAGDAAVALLLRRTGTGLPELCGLPEEPDRPAGPTVPWSAPFGWLRALVETAQAADRVRSGRVTQTVIHSTGPDRFRVGPLAP